MAKQQTVTIAETLNLKVQIFDIKFNTAYKCD